MESNINKTVIAEAIEANSDTKFPCGTCCATNHRCAECRHMEMDNDHYNDGTRRCAYKGRWLRPSTPACPYFSY